MNTQTNKTENTKPQATTPNNKSELYELIEKRNLEIVKCLLEMKYLTAEQLERKFFSFAKAKSSQYLASCIKKLTELEFIQKKTYDKFEIYIPTEKAYAKLSEKADGKIVTKPNPRVFEPRLNHDLKLTDIRFKLEETGKIKKWVSENMMKEVPKFLQLFTDLPDGLITNKDGISTFLELEISRKTNQKYMDRIAEYKKVLSDPQLKSQKIHKIQFVCTDIKVHELLKGLTAGDKQFEVILSSEYGV